MVISPHTPQDKTAVVKEIECQMRDKDVYVSLESDFVAKFIYVTPTGVKGEINISH